MIRKGKRRILLPAVMAVFLLVSCGKEDYLNDMNINILDSFTKVSVMQTDAAKEYTLSYNLEDEYIISKEIDYHNKYLEYIDEIKEFGMTESEILAIIEVLSNKNLNEYEAYNLALLKFYVNKYYEYDYEVTSKYDAGETVFFDYGDSVEIDLDNDGINETLMISVSRDIDNSRMWQWNISINGVNPNKSYMVDNPAEQYAIVKIGNKNRIILSGYGQSYDDFALLFTWEDNTIINMCDNLNYSINGEIKSNDTDMSQLKGLEAVLTPERSSINVDADDKVIITVPRRLSKLQTWRTKVNYVLTGDYLEELSYEEGCYPIYFPVFLLEDITLYKEMNEESETFLMEKGQVVILEGTDDQKFLKISNTYDETGWFLFNDVKVTDVFFGLFFYD